MDTGIHQLDLLSWYLGTPAEVFAYSAIDPARLESEVVCTAVFKFTSGAIAEFFCNWAAFRSPPARIRNNEGLSVFGKRGSLYVMDYETLILAAPSDDPALPHTRELKVDNPGEWVVMWGHFIDCLRTGAVPLTNGPESKKAVELVAAIYRSLESGAPVPLAG